MNRPATVKTPAEIVAIRRACQITDQTFAAIWPKIKLGLTERELSQQIDQTLGQFGADDLAFPTIVAFGPNAANPHAEPTKTSLKPGQLIKLDFGAKVDGWCADLSRTLASAPLSHHIRHMIHAVLAAQRAAFAVLRPGISGQVADTVARQELARRGFGDKFIHSLGHGLGREVHDGGSAEPKKS